MKSWVNLSVILLSISSMNCYQLKQSAKPDVICYVQLYPELSALIRTQLPNCGCIIVNKEQTSREKLSRMSDIANLRSSVDRARILLSIPLHSELDQLRTQAGCEKLVQRISVELRHENYDGVDLDLDPGSLDGTEQVNYVRFLRLLRVGLGQNATISTTIGSQRRLAALLIKTMKECLDFVILLPNNKPALKKGVEGDFSTREYTDGMVATMLEAGFPASKLVLGIQTAGIMVNPSALGSDLVRRRRSGSGVLSYGQVCELRDYQTGQHLSLFGDGTKIVNDDPHTVKRRSVECVEQGLRGVSILLNFDDCTGICTGRKFPLLESILDVFDNYRRSSTIDGGNCTSENVVGQEISTIPAIPTNRQLNSEETVTTTTVSTGREDMSGRELLTRLEAAIENEASIVAMMQSVADTLLAALSKVVDLTSSLVKQTDDGEPKPVKTFRKNGPYEPKTGLESSTNSSDINSDSPNSLIDLSLSLLDSKAVDDNEKPRNDGLISGIGSLLSNTLII